MFEKNGIIILNKPVGMSSSLAVQIAKRKLKPNKIGHLGTLDPLGTGVLLLAVNKATKLFDQYLTKTKVYKTIFKFGIETDTLDSEGKIINSNNKIIILSDVLKVLPKFIGVFDQLPPLYSAKKINGKKAYQLARQGHTVTLKTRQVEIYKFCCIEQIETNTFLFEIECSAGTYIRSICRDIAKELGTYGTMVSIVRTKCGVHTINESCMIEDILTNLAFVEINP